MFVKQLQSTAGNSEVQWKFLCTFTESFNSISGVDDTKGSLGGDVYTNLLFVHKGNVFKAL